MMVDMDSTPGQARMEAVDHLHARLSVVCTILARAHADLVDITADALRDDAWAEAGIRSPEHWLVVRAALSPARARELVALARRRDELPDTIELLATGRLGIDQAVVVARHVPAEYGQSVAELAEHATVPQLRRCLSRYDFLDDTCAEAEADAPAHTDATDSPGEPDGTLPADPDLERASLSMSTVDGRFQLSFTAPAHLGALVEQAIREAKDALFATGRTDATLADGLIETARRSLTGIPEGSRASIWRIYAHLDTHGGFIATGGRLPTHMIERITCDGILRPVWETDATPVSVGRAQRIVPARTRRLVLARDQGCRYPGCTVGAGHVEIHHIDHWRTGGATDLNGLVALCDYHHDRHHEGTFTITGSPTTIHGLGFHDRYGTPIGPLTAGHLDTGHPDTGHPDIRASVEPITWRGPTGEILQTRWVDFTPDRALHPPDELDELDSA